MSIIMRRFAWVIVTLAMMMMEVVWSHDAACLVRAADTDGMLEIRVIDKDTGQMIPARMHLKNSRGKPIKPPRMPFWNDHFVFPGKVVLELSPGMYTFELERGPEYRIITGHFEIKRGATDTKQIELTRFADLRKDGWWSGDIHIHRDPKDIELLMRAEDLHVAPVITWWNEHNAWKTQAKPAAPLVQCDTDRFYHLMAGEDERGGGALLYFNLAQPLALMGAAREYPSSVEFLKQTRGQPEVHVDIEKPFWWDMPLWIASGMTHSIGLCNNHMQRDGMMMDEAWGKPRDRLEMPNPHGNGRWSEHIYYQLLETGVRIPPSAGSASGVLPNPVGYNRVYVHCGSTMKWDQWWKNLQAGQVVVTNGPLISEPRVNGQLPGHVFHAEAGATLELQPTLNLAMREPVDYLEVVKNGRVVHQVRLDDWAKAGGSLPAVKFDASGWMLVRAVTSNPKTYRFASTGPYYIQIGDERRISHRATRFFLDWTTERIERLKLDDPQQRESVLRYHAAAKMYWEKMHALANADE